MTAKLEWKGDEVWVALQDFGTTALWRQGKNARFCKHCRQKAVFADRKS